MARLAIAAILTVTASVASADQASAHSYRVFVTVRGQGTIRLRLADGPSAPCDAGSPILFDGTIAAGQSVELQSATGFVCVEHTFGAFRGTNWSTPAILQPKCYGHRGRAFGRCDRFMRLELSTETPVNAYRPTQ